MAVTLSLVVFLGFLGVCWAYPTGAPTTACESMTPGHGVESLDANPYIVAVSAYQYSSGSKITVAITGNAFEGLILQARVVGTTQPVGTFLSFPPEHKGLACGNTDSTITHSSTASKQPGTIYMWTAPSSLTADIEFVATIAASKSVWWKNTKSPRLSFTLANGNGDSTTTTTTQTMTNPSSTTTTTTYPSGNKAPSFIGRAHVFTILLAISGYLAFQR